ncbi:hypothetical protein VPH35_053927 [Triticum aestivum]
MANMMEEASSFWCHACSRLHQTRAGEVVMACPLASATPSASLESIFDVVDARMFLDDCHPAGRHTSAHAEALPLVKLESDASAAETPCKHMCHPACLAPWLKARGTCLDRMVGVLDEDGMLMRHCIPLPYRAWSLGVLHGLHWIRHCAAKFGSHAREP